MQNLAINKDNAVIASSNLHAIDQLENLQPYIKHAIAVLIPWVDEIYSLEIRSDSVFARRYAKWLEELPIFSMANLDNGNVIRDLHFLLLYLYAYCFEELLLSSSFGQGYQNIISLLVSSLEKCPPDIQVRAELFRATIIGEVAYGPTKVAEKDLISVGEKYKADISSGVDAINGWDEKLTNWNNRANDLNEKLKDYVAKANFVGLSNAFSQMIAKKTNEKWVQVIFMFLFGMCLLAVPAIPVFLKLHGSLTDGWTLQQLPNIAPFLVVELMLLYFFRIFARNFYSTKAQLLQLELRYNICAFIQGYGEFVDKNRTEKDVGRFDRFETLIFSGITADFKNIPSHFDGLEQIAKVIKELKNK